MSESTLVLPEGGIRLNARHGGKRLLWAAPPAGPTGVFLAEDGTYYVAVVDGGPVQQEVDGSYYIARTGGGIARAVNGTYYVTI